jgi:hypothetical protein
VFSAAKAKSGYPGTTSDLLDEECGTMKLRSLILPVALATAALAPVPALASDSGPADMARSLNDPAMQRSMVGALAAMTEAMMNIDLAPFAQAMDASGDHRTARRLARHGTLRELAGRDAERIPEEMTRRLPQMMGMMAGMAGMMQQMMPALEQMSRQMGTAMDHATPDPEQAPDAADPPAGEATEG